MTQRKMSTSYVPYVPLPNLARTAGTDRPSFIVQH